MDVDIGLLQPFWLILLPLPWLWLYWRLHHPGGWPRILPILSVRYPLIAELQHSNKVMAAKAKSRHPDQLMALAISLMLLALSQPVYYQGDAKSEKQFQPVDLVLVVGTALSMSLSDYEINGQAVDRITMTRQLLHDFVADYSGQRIGLVILGNPPAIWLPLTSDKHNVQDAISRIRTFLGGRLTDMGASLNLVREHYNEPQEKVVVLISDGGAQVGSVSPQEAAQDLAEAGFTLYVIAVGSSDPEAGALDKSSLIYETVNLAMLQQVAEQGNGQLFHALDSQAFTDALKIIESKHRRVISHKEKKRLMQVWYPFPLALAMLILLYAALVQPGNRLTSGIESGNVQEDA